MSMAAFEGRVRERQELAVRLHQVRPAAVDLGPFQERAQHAERGVDPT